MFRELLLFKRSDRKWHLPVLAGLSVGIPILAGYYSGNLSEGKMASLAGLVILYIHAQPVAKQLVTWMSCSFGLMFSFTIGLVFGFDPFLACLILAIHAFAVHLGLFYLKMTRPPGNFFFIMIASVAICMPFDPQAIPHKVGLFAMGTMVSCLLGLGYILLTARRIQPRVAPPATALDNYENLIESVTFGLLIGVGLLIGRLLDLENPYWIPASCAAVMQGVNTKHVWQRSIQRITGTLIGLIVTWAILLLNMPVLYICLSIILLQIIVEILVVRNYGVAAIFITVLTIFLAESDNVLKRDPTALITARFIDILIGSLMGAIGGWILYHERIRYLARKNIRKTRIIFSRRRW